LITRALFKYTPHFCSLHSAVAFDTPDRSRALIRRTFLLILLIGLAATLEGRGAASVYSWPPAKGTLLVANSYGVTAYSNQHGGDISPLAVTSDMAYVSGIARDSAGRIYVTNEATNTVTVYPSNSSGNVAPLAVIAGANTKLASPVSIALDAAGQIYVVNSTNYPKGTINVYPPLGAATGLIDEPPTAVIAGEKTGLDDPSAVAVDPEGKIYVTNEIGGPRVKGQKLDVGSVTIYPPGANGNVKPVATIQGAATGLSFPEGLALDSAGNIYVANIETANAGDDFAGSITVYTADSNGDATPIALIAGPDTALFDTKAIALDSIGNIYAETFVDDENYQGYGVNVYPAASDGNVAPALTIAGSDTSLNEPSAFTLDSTGNLYVSNYFGGPNGGGSVIVFPPSSNGDAAPETVITSSFTGLDSPSGIAATASDIFVANRSGGSSGQGSVSVYPIAGYATMPPEAVITGIDTGLDSPFGIASDSNGNLAVLNSNNTITEYSAGSSGDALPSDTISFDANGKNQPIGLAMDSHDRIYLLNVALKEICKNFPGFSSCFFKEIGGSVAAYRPNSDGDAKPSATIAGGNSGISSPSAIAADPSGNVYVANQGPVVCHFQCICLPAGPGSITVYSSGAGNDAFPLATISGPNTELEFPSAITTDASGNIYALNDKGPIFGAGFCVGVGFGTHYPTGNARVRPPAISDDPILMFPAGSNGNVAPIAIIGGPSAALFGSSSIAFSPGSSGFSPSGGFGSLFPSD
jgi:hypothetical protein